MKWITHKSIALASGVMLGFSPATLVGVFVGSILPDIIDLGVARMTPCPEKTFKRIHRGFSHWYGTYLLAGILCFSALQGMNIFEEWGFFSSKELYFSWGFGLSYGALMHIILDMCTPSGVPLLPFVSQKRFSLNLFATGSIQEYAFLLLAMVGFAYYVHTLDRTAWQILEDIGANLRRTFQKL